jgi:hypothetical protein
MCSDVVWNLMRWENMFILMGYDIISKIWYKEYLYVLQCDRVQFRWIVFSGDIRAGSIWCDIECSSFETSGQKRSVAAGLTYLVSSDLLQVVLCGVISIEWVWFRLKWLRFSILSSSHELNSGAKQELSRFRDSDGLALLKQYNVQLDAQHVCQYMFEYVFNWECYGILFGLFLGVFNVSLHLFC